MRVLNTHLTVENYHDPSGSCGEYSDYPAPTIRINTAYSGLIQLRTTVHEYFHALYNQVHDPDDDGLTEEQAARLFEVGVVDLVTQNWSLLKALRGEE